VRSPQRPDHWWGNLLLFEAPPGPGDGERWEGLFEEEFCDLSRVRHRTFAWDTTDGEEGAAAQEFAARGYDLDRMVGLIATVDQIRPHPRANREVLVRRLDPRPGHDEELWEGVRELGVAGRDPRIPEPEHRAHRAARLSEMRALFRARGGGWYVALDPGGGGVLASCGLVLGAGLASIQDVDTIASHRRKGISSRLLVEAVHDLAAREGTPARVVIAADPDYHALGLYESLGFRALERCAGVCRMPPSHA
jgi:ribosomal protein S18 acetylase RimI-like enzyme